MKMILNEHIESSGLKRKYINEQLGISKNTLKNWCESKTYPPLDKAVQLAAMLGVDIKELYED